jgi:hypothetical protein
MDTGRGSDVLHHAEGRTRPGYAGAAGVAEPQGRQGVQV